jgi:hypothetical protein
MHNTFFAHLVSGRMSHRLALTSAEAPAFLTEGARFQAEVTEAPERYDHLIGETHTFFVCANVEEPRISFAH